MQRGRRDALAEFVTMRPKQKSRSTVDDVTRTMPAIPPLRLATFALLALPACASALAPAPVPPHSVAPMAVAVPPASTTAAPMVAPEPAATPPDPRSARLAQLCTLWGNVRYLDPWVVEGGVDWDAALVAALPKALAAQNDGEAALAVDSMLSALHDSATRVLHEVEPAHPAAATPIAPSRTVDGVLVARVVATGWQGVDPAVARISPELEKAKLVVLDIRATTREDADGAQLTIEKMAAGLPSHESVGITQRFVEHRGYRPQTGITSGGYETLLATILPPAFAPATRPHPSRVVFLTNAMTGVPEVAWAMQHAGDATIVVQGSLAPDEFAATDIVPLAGGFRAHVRHAEIVGAPPRADVELDMSTSEDKVVEAAVRAAHRTGAMKAPATVASARGATWRPDLTYAADPYPTTERRVLALFRFWNVIHYFYPYLPLMGDTWDRALVEFLPRFEGAANAHEYVLAVAELAAKIPDGHVGVWGSKELRSIFGAARPPFETRMIEGQPTVTSLLGDASLSAAGLAVGDVVVAVDGEPIATRMSNLAKYITASTDAWRGYRTLRSALTGAAGSTMKLTTRGKSGATREVSVPRSTNWSPVERTGAVYRLVEDGVGYVDLDRLENGDVDAMFTAFEKTRAIVFDMRGYPHGTAWSIGPRINVRGAHVAAQFFEPFVTLGSLQFTFLGQGLSSTDKPLYRGKTVMLVDERTMSQAEHTGLFFEAANGTTFVGSQTSGANGDVTNLSLPGGLFVSFSGHDVRHADGRQLQRVGLVPDIEAHATLGGVREGRDEVLERALLFLRTGK